MNLWNANADSVYPQSKRELLKALETWEKAHVKPPNNKTKTAEWSDQAWSHGHQHNFSDLIEQAKRNVTKEKCKDEKAMTDLLPLNDVDAGQIRDATKKSMAGGKNIGSYSSSKLPPALVLGTETSSGALSMCSPIKGLHLPRHAISLGLPVISRPTPRKRCDGITIEDPTGPPSCLESGSPSQATTDGRIQSLLGANSSAASASAQPSHEHSLQSPHCMNPQLSASLPHFSIIFSNYTQDQNGRPSFAPSPSSLCLTPTPPEPARQTSARIRANEKRKYSSIEE